MNIIDAIYWNDVSEYFWHGYFKYAEENKFSDNKTWKIHDELDSKLDFWRESRNITYYRTQHSYSYVDDIFKKTAYGLSASLLGCTLLNDFLDLKDNDRLTEDYCMELINSHQTPRKRTKWESLVAYLKTWI